MTEFGLEALEMAGSQGISGGRVSRGYRTIRIKLRTSELTVHTSPRLADALEEISKDLTLYQGVRFGQILEAVYRQGLKDGAAKAFGELENGLRQAKQLVPHKRPGRPKRRQ